MEAVTTEGWMINSGECFLEPDTRVDVKFRGGEERHNRNCDYWSWNFSDDDTYSNDIMFWRLSEKVANNYVEELSEAPLQIVDKPIVSDGSSSSYYTFDIKNKAGQTITVEVGDVCRAMVGNDFDLSNIIKAARRLSEASQGRGKAGASVDYDCNKVVYFANEFKHWNKEKA